MLSCKLIFLFNLFFKKSVMFLKIFLIQFIYQLIGQQFYSEQKFSWEMSLSNVHTEPIDSLIRLCLLLCIDCNKGGCYFDLVWTLHGSHTKQAWGLQTILTTLLVMIFLLINVVHNAILLYKQLGTKQQSWQFQLSFSSPATCLPILEPLHGTAR